MKYLIRVANFLNILTEDGSLDTTNIIIILIAGRLLVAPVLDYAVIGGLVSLIGAFSYKHYLVHKTVEAKTLADNTIQTQLDEHKAMIEATTKKADALMQSAALNPRRGQ